MEIGRWGFKKITHISDRCREFQTFLADVLEGDRGLIAAPLSKTSHEEPFVICNDFSLIKKNSLSHGSDQAIAVFRMLAPYFEVGFLLRQPRLLTPTDRGCGSQSNRFSGPGSNRDEISLRAMFIYGKIFVSPEQQAPQVNLSLPLFARDRVYRGRLSAALKAFQLESLRGLQTANVFAFVPMPGVTLVLICNRPPPWQVLALEQAFLSVQELVQKGSA